MAERTEITRNNLRKLVADPAICQEMEKLLKETEKLGLRVFLLPSGRRFDIDNGVITGPAVTSDLPLTYEVVSSLQQAYWLIAASLYHHSEADSSITTNTSLDKTYRLVQGRKETKDITQQYFEAAEDIPCDMGAFGNLLQRVSAMKDRHLDIYSGGDNGDLIMKYTRSVIYPFDPLTEPVRLKTEGTFFGEWSFLVPEQWQLLVALVLYDEDQAKASKTAEA